MPAKRSKKPEPPEPEAPPEAAFRIWSRFVICHRDIHPDLAALYSKKAHIEQVGRLEGTDKVVIRLRLDPHQWRKLMPKLMEEAKAKGDRSSFSDWTFEEVPEGITVTATRFSELNRYSVPHRLVVGKAEDGEWLIIEETMNVVKKLGPQRDATDRRLPQSE
jgi:hypothetical protein